jgi:choline monooxygenase
MTTALDDLLSRFDDRLPLERARTIPSAWYLEPAMHEAERERVFGNTWQAVGRLDQLSSPGSFFTLDLAGDPIVVVRDEQGEMRAFYNVCRHKGARVACEDQGCATRFRCRYHGWTYDLAGRLRGTPEFDGVAEFRREDNGLPQIAVGTWAGLVWVHAGQSPAPLDEWVQPLARKGFDKLLAPFQFVGRREYRLACNWKVYVDNYLDGGYHVNTIHPGLASALDYTHYRTEIDEHVSFQISPLSSRKGDTAVTSVRTGDMAYYAWVFPNLMLNYYEGVLDTNLVQPDGPGACRVIFDYYFTRTEGEGARQFMDESMAVTHQVQVEDGDICEEVQRGLASRSYDTGRFSVRREAGGYHFHQCLARWLRAVQQDG